MLIVLNEITVKGLLQLCAFYLDVRIYWDPLNFGCGWMIVVAKILFFNISYEIVKV